MAGDIALGILIVLGLLWIFGRLFLASFDNTNPFQ